jgi:hypothetical protein
MGQAFGLQQQRFHLHLHARMGMVIPLVVQLFYFLLCEGQMQHGQTSL